MLNKPQGINFSSHTLSAPQLARALCRTASFIQDIEPHGLKLQKYHDWWEHDGLHFGKGTMSLHELFEMVSSPRSLLAAMPGDECVFIGIAPDSHVWYLRFYLSWDDEGFDLSGRFDITLPTHLAPTFRERMLGVVELKQQDAEAYYSTLQH